VEADAMGKKKGLVCSISYSPAAKNSSTLPQQDRKNYGSFVRKPEHARLDPAIKSFFRRCTSTGSCSCYLRILPDSGGPSAQAGRPDLGGGICTFLAWPRRALNHLEILFQSSETGVPVLEEDIVRSDSEHEE
ncbi:hypothetical protein Taro_029630, partial [Colocasia esculenta]|nr:hypothetical protein [Colocasia esculenta]